MAFRQNATGTRRGVRRVRAQVLVVAGACAAALLTASRCFVAPRISNENSRRAALVSAGLLSLASPVFAAPGAEISFALPENLSGEFKKDVSGSGKEKVITFEKQNGVVVKVGLVPPSYLKKEASKWGGFSFSGPRGVDIMKYDVGGDLENFEYRQNIMGSFSSNQPSTFSWFQAGGGPMTATHYWYKTVKYADGVMKLMYVEVPEELFAKESPAMVNLLSIFA